MELVVDASVVLKWFLTEEGSSKALQIRRRHLEGELILSAPSLLVIEIANALATKSGANSEAVISALKVFYYTKVRLYPITRKLIQKASLVAVERKITVYDALYVVLAESLGCRFITSDKKLFKKISDLEVSELLK